MRGTTVDPSVEARFDRTARLNSLTDATILGALCSCTAVERLAEATEALSPRDKRNFLRGYRLAVATPLYGLLQFVIGNHQLLGCAYDGRVANWFDFARRERNVLILSAVSDHESDLARLCSSFDDLVISLRRADAGLDATAAALKDCEALAESFRAVAPGCKVVSRDNGEEVADGERIFLLCVAERVLDYVDYNRSIRMGALDLVWRGGGESTPLEEFTLESETSLDVPFSWHWGDDVPARWAGGFLYGLDLAIRLNDITLPSHSASSDGSSINADWFDEILHFVNPTHPDGRFPSLEYGLSEFSQAAVSEMISQLPAVKRVVPPADRLKAILGPDTVRLATSQGATDTLDLEITLTGAVSVYGDSRVQVLIITHSVEQDDRDWVSIAVRCRLYGCFTNASKWHLFYKVYHNGHITDTDVGRALGHVEEILTRFEDNLNYERISGISGDDLLQYCELPAFRAMRELSLKAVEVNAELRAGNSELMSAFWMQSRGYNPVRASFEHASLGETEYDSIGIRDHQCLVLEVKSGDFTDLELQDEIVKFARKVERLRSKLPVVAQALGYDGHIDSISGIFISRADLEDFNPSELSVEIWDYDRFVQELTEAGLSKRLLSLLRKEHIIRQLDDSSLFQSDKGLI